MTKESDGVLHQMTWPPQSPDLNPIKIVWDELDRRVKEKQQRSAAFKTVGKAFQVKLVEKMPRVCKAVIKAKGSDFEKSKIYFGYYMIPYALFQRFDVFTLFYNVENSKNKEKCLNE